MHESELNRELNAHLVRFGLEFSGQRWNVQVFTVNRKSPPSHCLKLIIARCSHWVWMTELPTAGSIPLQNYKLLIITFKKCFLACPNMKALVYLCTLFDIQCCQSVIRKLVYGFMCRLDSSVNCIIKGILATSLRYTSRIRNHWCSLLYINSWQINRCFFHNVYNLHVMLDNILYYLSTCMDLRLYVLLVCILYCWVWNKAIELNWITDSNRKKWSIFTFRKPANRSPHIK